MAELNRITSHVTWAATNGMDLASTTMMIFGFREREMILSFFEKTTGLRMNTNYIRPGGVAADLPDGWEDDVTAIVDTIEAPRRRLRRAAHRPADLPRAHRRRRHHLARAGRSRCRPPARSCAPRACRGTSARAMPYLAYDEVDFDVIVGTVGDTFDRYAVRLNEIRESIRDRPPVRRADAARRLPGAGQEGDAAAACPHRRVDGGAHPPLQALHPRASSRPRGGLRRGRVASRRARLLPGLGRLEQAVPDARPGAELRQPPERAGAAPRRADRRRDRDLVLGRPGARARSTADGASLRREPRTRREALDRALPASGARR